MSKALGVSVGLVKMEELASARDKDSIPAEYEDSNLATNNSIIESQYNLMHELVSILENHLIILTKDN